jgi:hypothetical protein
MSVSNKIGYMRVSEIMYADPFNTRTFDVHSITSIYSSSCKAVVKLSEFNIGEFWDSFFFY